MTEEERKALLAELAKRYKVDETLAGVVSGETPEEIEANIKQLSAALTSKASPKITKPEPSADPKAAGFSDEQLNGLLDKLVDRFGEDAVNGALGKRLGVDKLEGRIGEMEMNGARSALALQHGLTAEQAAAIPGSTPAELKVNLEFAKGIAGSTTVPDKGGAAGGNGVEPRKIGEGRGRAAVLTVEEAEADFINSSAGA